MAITAQATILDSSTTLPAGYTPPELPIITPVEDGDYVLQVPIAQADAADPTTTLSNIIAFTITDFESVTGVAKKIGETSEVTANLTIRNLKRTNTNSDILVLGAEIYELLVSFEYE